MVVTFLPSAALIGVHARAHRRAVEMHRAGAAQGHAAAEFRARHLQLVAQIPEQGHRGDRRRSRAQHR
jgi:hypothetical protein